jgi:hypothetical protein
MAEECGVAMTAAEFVGLLMFAFEMKYVDWEPHLKQRIAWATG